MLYDTDCVHGSLCTRSVKLSRACGCLGQKVPRKIGAAERTKLSSSSPSSAKETIRVPAIADCVHDEHMDACTHVMNAWTTYEYIHTYTYMT